ncbi:hypothetical protein NDU88_001896 [Pleurodeles waltl]|uniref:Uncharacterized protein n=1 Tax=Pleurodeles waltl TaxID=8319 RepID=A0AAV7W1D6_PLEWA|nr:hypothetical protein NDU88_001896 [Pleurodeles waltl]
MQLAAEGGPKGPEEFSPKHPLRQEPWLCAPSGTLEEPALPTMRNVLSSRQGSGGPEDYGPQAPLAAETWLCTPLGAPEESALPAAHNACRLSLGEDRGKSRPIFASNRPDNARLGHPLMYPHTPLPTVSGTSFDN